MQWEIRRYGVVGSTNDELKALTDRGATEGTAVVAEGQNAGRGRSDHQWFSPEGRGLYFSCLLRPTVRADQLSTLTLMAGLATCDAIEMFVTMPVQIKWPNDIWLARRKVGGILSELVSIDDDFAGDRRPATGDAVAVIIGIGINVNLRQDEFPRELQETATSLAAIRGQPMDKELLLQAILVALAARYEQWQGGGWPSLKPSYLARSAIEGERVRVTFGNEVQEGLVQGVDDSGNLVLTRPDGRTETVVAGDVEIIVPVCLGV